jgi:hypothetical protein
VFNLPGSITRWLRLRDVVAFAACPLRGRRVSIVIIESTWSTTLRVDLSLGREIIRDSVIVERQAVTERGGAATVKGEHDGTFDKTKIPGELIMTSYYCVVDRKVVNVTVMNGRRAEY